MSLEIPAGPIDDETAVALAERLVVDRFEERLALLADRRRAGDLVVVILPVVVFDRPAAR